MDILNIEGKKNKNVEKMIRNPEGEAFFLIGVCECLKYGEKVF